MGLKQSIVIVSQYTVKTKGGGTRGGTPGQYVLRYMARDGATEDLTPIRRAEEDYVTRYMARAEAVDRAQDVDGVKSGMKEVQGMGGIAFGYGEPSLSHEKLLAASRDIQEQFDNGKTVLKTVLSFEEQYLKDNGVIPEDFVWKRGGDYRGNIDQMKLRLAIMDGLSRMGRHYDDLQYVGVIQVDTAHVHCHLAMVDRGRGDIMPDGNQRGKILESVKKDLRRGIDMSLDDAKTVQYMSSNVTMDRRNSLCFIKKFVHRTMDEHGVPQFLLACLPENKDAWRARSNAEQMRKPNFIVREFVEGVLKEPGSGYKEAIRDIAAYADARASREGLSADEQRKLVERGRERLVTECMDGVYSVLRRVPDGKRTVHTPMMDVMSMDYSQIASHRQEDPLVEFGFKLRSYSSRLEHHRKEAEKYHAAVKQYEAQDVPEDSPSRALYDFFQFEEEYNERLACKYRHFLGFLPPGREWEEDLRDLLRVKKRRDSLQKLSEDPSAKRMSPERAEDYGRRVYGMPGGRYAALQPEILAARLSILEDEYSGMEEEFVHKISLKGLKFDGRGVKRGEPYDFDDVKALDIHHLGYDFPDDAPISSYNVDEFVQYSDIRYALYRDAEAYLEGSGQQAALSSLPVRDIEAMREMADRIRVHPVLEMAPLNPAGGGRRHTRTVTLDDDYIKDMRAAISSTIRGVQLGDE